jgi:rhomboid protease GluP
MANCIRCGRQLSGFSFGKKLCPWCVRHEAYQRGELADDAPQPVMPTPWVRRGQSTITLTHILFGINLVMFLAMAPDTLTITGFPEKLSIRWGANFAPYTLSGEWWRLVTYMFLHANLLHIGFNMWCLWDLGALCESLYGPWTYGAIYFTSGIGGALASLFWNRSPLTIGASGAIFGLAGALIASFKLGEFSVPRSALSGTLRSLMIFVGFNLIFGATMPGIDNACHIGGLITGLIVGALIAVLAPQSGQALRRVGVFAVMMFAFAGGAIQLAHYHGLPLRFGRTIFAPVAKVDVIKPPSGEAFASTR